MEIKISLDQIIKKYKLDQLKNSGVDYSGLNDDLENNNIDMNSFFERLKQILHYKADPETLTSFLRKNGLNELLEKYYSLSFKGMEEKADEIIGKINPKLSEKEIAFYAYMELGMIMSDNPMFPFLAGCDDKQRKTEIYDEEIFEEDGLYYGICKHIAVAYKNVIEKINEKFKTNIKCELLYKTSKSTTHVDLLLDIGGKIYYTNLISDLDRIKSSRIPRGFGRPKTFLEEDGFSLREIESRYGKLSEISEDEIRKMEKKLGYSGPKTHSGEINEIYFSDILELLKNDLEEFTLRDKIKEIFEKGNIYTHMAPKIGRLELIRMYMFIFKKVVGSVKKEDFEFDVNIYDDEKISMLPITISFSFKDDLELKLLLLKESLSFKAVTEEEINEYIDQIGSPKIIYSRHISFQNGLGKHSTLDNNDGGR